MQQKGRHPLSHSLDAYPEKEIWHHCFQESKKSLEHRPEV